MEHPAAGWCGVVVCGQGDGGRRGVERRLARIGGDRAQPRARTHMVLTVNTGPDRWLVDVGFGSGPLRPLPLQPDLPVTDGAWTYRLANPTDTTWQLQELVDDQWVTQYTTAEEALHLSDVIMANHYTATWPDSPFTHRPIVVRKDEHTIRRLLGRHLSINRPGHPTIDRQLCDARMAPTLHDLGLGLAPADVDALLATLQVSTPATTSPRLPADVVPPEDPVRLAIIIGSVRASRIGPTVARWFQQRAQRRDNFDTDLIDLAELTLPPDLSGSGDTSQFSQRIAAADAIALVTPEYNHGYPGALKIAIDTLRDEWRTKPVGFVSYGGAAGGLRAVEQLRPVFAELHAVTMRDAVSFPSVHRRFDEHSQLLTVDPHTTDHLDTTTEALLDQLTWWTTTTRSARYLPTAAA